MAFSCIFLIKSFETFKDTSASSKATLTSLKVVSRSFSVIAPLLERL